MKRAGVLGTIVMVGMIAAVVGAQGPQMAPVAKIQKVKDNLYTIFGQGGNTTVFVTANGVVLVDTKLANNGQAILDQIKTLVDGKPAANQLVLYGGLTATNAGIEAKSVRSDAQGVATILLSTPGIWYIKFIHMAKVQGDSVDYESKWASLTFEVR